MKTFIPNKKWVMTGALLAVLGVNVSFNSHKYGIATADFASTSMEFRDEEIATAEGIQNVRYVQIEEGKVLALKKDTEGKVCYDCTARSFKIDNANLADIKNLNVKYLQEISKLPTPPASKSEERKEVGGDEGGEHVSNGALEEVLDKCKKKDNDSEKLSCLSTKFLAALKGKKAEGISPEEATEFFKTEIAPLIAGQIKDARHAAVKQYRAMVGTPYKNSPYYADNSDFADFESDMDDESSSADAEGMLQSALDVVEKMHGEVPKKFADIRKELVKTQKQILEKHSQDIAKSMRMAYEKRNTFEGNVYSQEATLLRNSMLSTVDQMKTSTKNGLWDAYSSDLINRATRDANYNAFTLSANGLTNSMQKFYSDWLATGNPPQIGLSNDTIPVGVDLTGRLNGTANRGGVIVVPQSGLSNRNSLNLSSTAAATPAVDPSTGNLVWVIPQNNTGVEFGTVVPLTQSNSAFLEQMRAQQNIQRGN